MGIVVLKKVQINLELTTKINQRIIESGWPKEVPIIKTEFIDIRKQSEKSWSITVNKPVSYSDFREYLLELYGEGFKPISEMGAKSPKLLSLDEPQDEGFILVWAGKNSDYTVETFWKKSTIMNASGEVVEDDYVTILLYSNQDDEIHFGDEVDSENIDIETMSGDTNFLSGDSIDLSGDNISTSGDVFEEDRNER